MHCLNTINRLNEEAHAEAITKLRKAGNWVVATFEGLSLVTHETHPSLELAVAAADTVEKNTGQRKEIFSPIPSAAGTAPTATRDQSEDHGASYASIDAYLNANPSARPGLAA